MLINAISKSLRRRQMSTVCSTFLRYSEYGDPLEVLHKATESLPAIKPDEVLIKMLVAPINPADINTLQGRTVLQRLIDLYNKYFLFKGKYPDRPPLPAIPGNEGVAEVLQIGADVKNVTIGDHIIPVINATGTWRSHSIQSADTLLAVPKEMDLVAASQLTVNPSTAYRMLRDFVKLQQGDTVIQNGGNSACGQAVIQLCRIWGLNCVSVVRNRPEIDELTAFLKKLGATEVLTEEQIRTTTIFKDGCLPKPKLALNCVGGKSATEILRHLADRGQLITYGAMSRESVTAPNAALIFKDIQFRGFWMSRWTKANLKNDERTKMLNELIGWYVDGQLQAPAHQLVDFTNHETAIRQSIDFKGFNGKKFLFDFRQ